MPPSILRWIFYSPLRLAMVSLAVAGILVGGVLLATTQAQHDPRSSVRPVARRSEAPPATPPPTAAPTPAPSSPSESVGRRERLDATIASRLFVTAWARNGPAQGRAGWLRSIRPLTTDSLFRGLKVTDLARLPGGVVRRVRLQEVGAFVATSTVTLTGGLRVQVHLVAENGRWVVADVRPVVP